MITVINVRMDLWLFLNGPDLGMCYLVRIAVVLSAVRHLATPDNTALRKLSHTVLLYFLTMPRQVQPVAETSCSVRNIISCDSPVGHTQLHRVPGLRTPGALQFYLHMPPRFVLMIIICSNISISSGGGSSSSSSNGGYQ